MKKYMIDYTEGSGSGCDKLFDTRDDARFHMDFYTDKEREGLEVVEVEVGYLVTMYIGDKKSRYVWRTEDVDDGGSVDCPNGSADIFPTWDDAEVVLEELQNYAESKGMLNTSFWIKEVVL
jgi:hypothetical protein